MGETLSYEFTASTAWTTPTIQGLTLALFQTAAQLSAINTSIAMGMLPPGSWAYACDESNCSTSVTQAVKSGAPNLKVMATVSNQPGGANSEAAYVSSVVKAIRSKRHIEHKLLSKPVKSVGSSANRGQMAATILAAHIRAGTLNPVKQTLEQMDQLISAFSEET